MLSRGGTGPSLKHTRTESSVPKDYTLRGEVDGPEFRSGWRRPEDTEEVHYLRRLGHVSAGRESRSESLPVDRRHGTRKVLRPVTESLRRDRRRNPDPKEIHYRVGWLWECGGVTPPEVTRLDRGAGESISEAIT